MTIEHHRRDQPLPLHPLPPLWKVAFGFPLFLSIFAYFASSRAYFSSSLYICFSVRFLLFLPVNIRFDDSITSFGSLRSKVVKLVSSDSCGSCTGMGYSNGSDASLRFRFFFGLVSSSASSFFFPAFDLPFTGVGNPNLFRFAAILLSRSIARDGI